MNKNTLLKHLQTDIYCRIQPSQLGGVGVFAVRKIPKGTNPFKNISHDETMGIDIHEVENFHPNVRKMIFDYFSQVGGKVHISEYGLNIIEITSFLNHSHQPNVDSVEEGFVANRDIEIGEELTSNYTTYNENEIDY